MRRITTLLAAVVLALGLSAGPALAMQPPGQGAQDNFGCDEDGEDDPVWGHPGSRNSAEGVGLAETTIRLMDEGHDHPTAWNAAHRTGDGPEDGPIVLGECEDDD